MDDTKRFETIRKPCKLDKETEKTIKDSNYTSYLLPYKNYSGIYDQYYTAMTLTMM